MQSAGVVVSEKLFAPYFFAPCTWAELVSIRRLDFNLTRESIFGLREIGFSSPTKLESQLVSPGCGAAIYDHTRIACGCKHSPLCPVGQPHGACV